MTIEYIKECLKQNKTQELLYSLENIDSNSLMELGKDCIFRATNNAIQDLAAKIQDIGKILEKVSEDYKS